ncbi:MAG: DUF5615 family PIN-like protein [Egibacteraceae bacterium]
MRFLLDNDVDAAVGRVLRTAGHQCWTAFEAGLAGVAAADDDDLSVYAQEHEVVVVTHDREFSRRRMAHTFGRHLWLRCEQPDASTLVGAHLDVLIQALQTRSQLVVTLSPGSGVQIHAPRWQ